MFSKCKQNALQGSKLIKHLPEVQAREIRRAILRCGRMESLLSSESLLDIRSGDGTGISSLHRYKLDVCELWGVASCKIDGTIVPLSFLSALWWPQGAYETLKHPCYKIGQLVMDKIYTRHVVAIQLAALSDRECRVLGTVPLNNIDDISRQTIKTAWEKLKTAERCAWRLVKRWKLPVLKGRRPEWQNIGDLLYSKIEQTFCITPTAWWKLPETALKCLMSRQACACTSWFGCHAG